MKKILILLILLFIGIGTSFLLFNHDNNKEKDSKIKKVEQVKIPYNKYVTTLNETILYKKIDNEFVSKGKVKKDTILTLEPNDINGYFKIEGLDYYIYYKLIEKYEGNYKTNDDFYNYIPFNELVYANNVNLYNDNNEIVYTLDDNHEFIPIIKDTDKTYIKFNKELFYINNTDIIKTLPSENTDVEVAKAVSVLTYHFFYDGTEEQVCDQIICIKKDVFDKQMAYLKENNYYTLSMKEFEYFLDKKINIPKNSVLITTDDGWMGTKTILPEILNKYDMKGTLFLINGSFNYEEYQFKNLELQSHSTQMHTPGVCNMGLQGGGILCLPENEVLNDLKTSKELLNARAFAYPFYDYSERAKRLVQEAGFNMAFVGRNMQAKPGIDKYKIPRFAIVADTTMKDFIRKLG